MSTIRQANTPTTKCSITYAYFDFRDIPSSALRDHRLGLDAVLPGLSHVAVFTWA